MFDHFKVPAELLPSDPRFGVGPSLIPVQALENLARTGTDLLGTSHRKDSVKNLVKELQDGLRSYFNLPSDYEIVLGNGGATLLWDMIGLGLVEKNSLHYTCGEFSEKWFRAHQQIPWIEAREEKAAYGEGIDVKEEAGVDFVACTLNETSTGVMLADVPALKGPDVLLGMDATSGAGQIEVDFKKVDFYYFSPQKVFAAEGGLYVAILSPKARARAEKILRDRSRFVPESLKLSHAMENSRMHQTYNTPAISTIFLMNEQVKLMNKLGQSAVIREAKRKAQLLYGWASEKAYLSPFIKDERYRSHAVATIDVDPKFNAEAIAKVLRAQKAAFDIESYRKLNRNQFRISLFHNVSYENLEKLTRIISLAIESQP